jgi:DNA-binding IclR family transcriptional regulator
MPNGHDGRADDTDRAASSPSVVAAFAILDAVNDATGPATMIEIARGLDLPKSSVSRMLSTLEGIGAVVRSPVDKRYSLGPKLGDYARSAPSPSLVDRFERVAGPHARSINETTQLGVLSGTEITFIACIDSTRPVRLVSYVGRTLPAHASATGKAILAYSHDTVVDAVIAHGLPAITRRTITDANAFRAELDTIREQGYATEAEESTENLACVSAPVFDAAAHPIAAITFCIPRAAIPQRKAAMLRDTALTISRELSLADAPAAAGHRPAVSQ